MWGGRILGKGTYGCIYQPILKCRKKKGKNIENSSDSKLVGKITSKRDSQNELAVAKILSKIKGSSNYTIISELDSCTPRAKSRQDDKDIERCDFLENNKLQDSVQLLMPWGGYPLSRINLDPHVFDFFRFSKEILACGAFLVTNNLCHFDIWGQNFLFDKHNKPKLIDFGFTFQPNKLIIDDLKERWRIYSFDHDTETPEVTLMLGTHDNVPLVNLINGLEREKPAVQRLVAFCEVNSADWSNDLLKWTKMSKSFQQHDWLHCWKVYWPGFDAWSIGAVLLQVLEIELSIPEFVNSASWISQGSKIKEVLKGLTRANPIDRLDAAEALSLLTNGYHPLISVGSVGSDWVEEKKRMRS
uniref:Protein kinase domain-containing protein n=1 Tax=viral metagenome TaxID=1070528 RepID=A0A6C0AMX2_9ZZZZ